MNDFFFKRRTSSWYALFCFWYFFVIFLVTVSIISLYSEIKKKFQCFYFSNNVRQVPCNFIAVLLCSFLISLTPFCKHLNFTQNINSDLYFQTMYISLRIIKISHRCSSFIHFHTTSFVD